MLRFTPAQRVHAVCAFVVPIVLVLMAAWSLPRTAIDHGDDCASQAALANAPGSAQQDCPEAPAGGSGV